ncbi:patatin-like phospholipase family protein [Ralstonia insidiosa]|nr:patatin-like phospholipase family protein [Ralstonia insidiosa]
MPAPKLRVAASRAKSNDTAEAASTSPSRIELPPYENIALVLQGGGALGSYQAGVFEGLDAAGIVPNWIAGISIGALNTAIIAGNAPEHRLAKLREFWQIITQPTFSPPLPDILENAWFDGNSHLRKWLTAMQAADTLIEGQRGFFTPRIPAPLPANEMDPLDASYYDTTPLKATLERLCDFDRINDGGIRVSVGVNVRTGNLEAFDNTERRLCAEHFMASGALPPGFPPVLIDGEYYWDGGVVSNTPLSYVLGSKPRRDTLVFQVDLWAALGPVPNTMIGVASRQKDLQYSSRTRLITDWMERSQSTRRLVRKMLEHLPEKEFERTQWYKHAQELACTKRYNVIHLIYAAKEHEGPGKDIQFGPSTMRDHWGSGLSDIRESLSHPEWLAMPDDESGFVTHDIHRHPHAERRSKRL